LLEGQNTVGWCKIFDWKKRIKIKFRKLQKTKKSRGKNKESRLKYATKNYLDIANTLQKKWKTSKLFSLQELFLKS
tara:strand:+ start:411 stop:638 length:228 start_codon:yes stop_codon:yes gene_type:complete